MLIDSNLIIYAAQPEWEPLRIWIERERPSVSIISRVEVLGFQRITPDDESFFRDLFASARILPVDRAVIDRAVRLRQHRRMSLGDALIAATALVHRLPLATHNTRDFDWIEGLSLLDPLTTPPPPDRSDPEG